eukprot:TRINITY_DN504_c1_g1_i14.p4 TRINITY_DN504_c1_g1~~TRINITY_DN504_c1_g1_i14.p4  ORF type:complete len:142 (-),score=0.56 TRINITY_DN504_c1_g1_i14:674-1099(-)
MLHSRGRGDEGTRGRGDEGTRGRGDEGTRGRGDEGTRGRGDEGTRGRGDEGVVAGGGWHGSAGGAQAMRSPSSWRTGGASWCAFGCSTQPLRGMGTRRLVPLKNRRVLRTWSSGHGEVAIQKEHRSKCERSYTVHLRGPMD